MFTFFEKIIFKQSGLMKNCSFKLSNLQLQKAPLFILFMGFFFLEGICQEVPAVHQNIYKGAEKYYIDLGEGQFAYEDLSPPLFTLAQLLGQPQGTETGIALDFQDENFEGTLVYGFIPYGDSKHPLPVYFRRTASIDQGKVHIPILGNLEGRFDMIGWKEKGSGTLGYRVIDTKGLILYDGRVSFSGAGPFRVLPTIIEGPFVNQVHESGVTISFRTHLPSQALVRVEEKVYGEEALKTEHQIAIEGLKPNTSYTYSVEVGEISQSYSFHTAPKPGSKQAFVFSYASDSRNGNGGGERNVYGANFYIMKKIMALNAAEGAAFMQFSGDMINGYLNHPGEMDLQYANWKRAIEPFAHYTPVYTTMGNHEALMRTFWHEERRIQIDRFPYAGESSEAVFAKNFVNPSNGPQSEDGASYDPQTDQVDFPPYKETVFYYKYANLAMVVLNSNYFYAPSTSEIGLTGGGLHAYIMDKQLAWFEGVLGTLEKDKNIDHVFVSMHTPLFPNGGHVKDDMWYNGNNSFRSQVGETQLERGIIERRDELLELMVNRSSKVRATLTGDEHNYGRTQISSGMQMYPDNYSGKKIQLNREIWQINNGAAGAPYYAQEKTPWSQRVAGFTTQNALVFFHVKGKSIELVAKNPDTLEEIERFILK